jgi:opacity protein-like surface antigen
MTRIAVVVVGAILLGAVTAGGQGVRYGVGAGLLLPVGDYHSLDKPGWIAGADVTYWFAPGSIAIRGEGSYSRTGERQGACCLTDHAFAIGGGMADLVYAFGKTTDQIRPYVLAGVGLYNVRLSAPGYSSSSETKIGFGGGAGLACRLGAGGTRLFIESKVTTVTKDSVNLIAIPIRIGFRFGAK